MRQHNRSGHRRRTAMVEVLEQRWLLTTIYSADMSTNPGWTLDNVAGIGWEYGSPKGTGGDPASGHTGSNVVGTILGGSYPNSVPSPWYATTVAINCWSYTDVTLSFWRDLGVVSGDTARIAVSSNGTTWTNVWSAGGTINDAGWTSQTYDISTVADKQSTVYIRWSLGPTNASGVSYGWNIDDVTLSGTFHTPPTVSSITRIGTSPTNASSVQYAVAFSAAVVGVDVTDFALASTGSASGTVASVSGSGSSYTVTVGSVAGAGTLGLNLVDDDTIADSYGYTLGGSGVGNGNFAGQSFTVDRVAPTVTSINVLGGQTANLAIFSVTFSESVTGVDLGDFNVAFTGTASGTLSGISGSGASYQVAVNTPVGDGTVRLNLVDNDSIADSLGNPLGGSGAGNGNSSGTGAVDHMAPVVTNVTPASQQAVLTSPFNVDVSFNEAVGSVDPTDLVLTGRAAASAVVGTPVNLGSNVWRFPVSGAGDGRLNLALAPDTGDITDLLGNSLAGISWTCRVNLTRKIIYSSYDPANVNQDIWTMNADGSSQVHLTSMGGDEWTPAYSHDGQKIVYTYDRKLWIANADGTGAVRLTNPNESQYAVDFGASFSPDDSRIVFGHNNGLGMAGGGLWIINTNGTGLTELYQGSGLDPCFSPDGSQIVFATNSSTSGTDISIVNANGSNQRYLTSTGNQGKENRYPAFSPDGTKIVFTSNRDAVTNYEIYVMDADGTHVTRLTNNAAGDLYARFSPDGQKIAFYSNRDGHEAIFTMNADGSAQTRITSASVVSVDPSWGIDYVAPAVASIDRVGPVHNSTSSVQFAVTFKEPVWGVDLSDFAIATTGTASGALASVSGSGMTYTVTVNNVAGDGTLALNLLDDDSIEDQVGNRLGGYGAGNGAFTGQLYEVDHTVPTVVSIVRATQSPNSSTTVYFTMTFSESVTGLDASDLAIATTGTATGVILYILPPLGPSSTYSIAITAGGDGTLGLNLVDDDTIRDLSDNRLGGSGTGNGSFTGEVYTLDHTPPVVTAIVRADANPNRAGQRCGYFVWFSESVSQLDTTDLTTALTGTVTAGAPAVGTYGPSLAYYIAMAPVAGDGTLRLDLFDDDSITDAAGNPLGGPGVGNGYFVGETYTVDNTAPTVLSMVCLGSNPTNAQSLRWLVTFSENVNGVDGSKFTLAVSGSLANELEIVDISGSGATYTVTATGKNLWPISGVAGVTLWLWDDDYIQDAAGNTLNGRNPGQYTYIASETFAVDTVAPWVQSITRLDPSPTRAVPLSWQVTFSEPVTGVDLSDFQVVVANRATSSSPSLTGSGQVYTYSVTVGGDGYVELTVVDDDSIRDVVNQRLGGTGVGNGNWDWGEEYRVDLQPPTLGPITASHNGPDTLMFALDFSETVSGMDVSDFDLVFTGSAAGSISRVVGEDARYGVEVTGLTGDGTVRLVLRDDDSVVDWLGNPIGGDGSGNGAVTSDAFIVDHTPPVVVSLKRFNATPTNETSLFWVLTAGEPLAGLDETDFAVITSGTVTYGSVEFTGWDGVLDYYIKVRSIGGDGTIALKLVDDDTIVDAIGEERLGNPLGGPGAGNGDFLGEMYTIDQTSPTIATVTGPADGWYRAGQNLDFTVNFIENVTVSGTPTIGLTIGSTSRSASYVSGNGSSSLVFRYTLQAGDSDADGIASASPLVLNGGTIQDAAGNGATLTFAAPITTGVLVDTVAPALPTSSINDGAVQRSMVKKLTLTFGEKVVLGTGAVTVKKSDGSDVPDTTLLVTNPSGDQRNYVLSFSGIAVVGGSLADGIYDLSVASAGVHDLAGNALSGSFSQRFHRLYGDYDGNRTINNGDYFWFKQTFGKNTGDTGFLALCDYDGNGTVNNGDYFQFKKRFGVVYTY